MKTTRIFIGKIQMGFVSMLLMVFGLIFTISCKDEDEPILESQLLQGTWVEIEPKDLGQFAGSNHTFVFREDSFFLKIESWTDVVYQDEEGNWVGPTHYGYRKGVYAFDANTITFNGELGLDSDFTGPSDGSKLQTFQMTYDYKLKSSNKIVLNPESEYESITLIKD